MQGTFLCGCIITSEHFEITPIVDVWAHLGAETSKLKHVFLYNDITKLENFTDDFCFFVCLLEFKFGVLK